MRTIKFRAWDTSSNKMIHKFILGNVTDMKDDRFTCPMVFCKPYWSDEYNWVHCDTLIITQFTGLLDKNGKEIYEGDIIKNDSFIPKVFYIGFSDGCYVAKSKDSAYPTDLYLMYDSTGTKVEVIGNIYENPELIP